jgi:DNA gyrase subunit A
MDQFAKETIPISLEEEMRKSYLDYAMSVIVGRALPDARDGLKPVHRRVLFAMHEMNNVWNRPYVKCARVVGDTMGKYHPHGDASIYDTLVRMAQDFSLRYTLVDGQGNFGSIDGDSAAAMRYTECRLDKIASELLADIDKDTVDFQPNYDGKEKEPTVLPTRIPNLLINGSSGIAVGMATNIPPHNLSEVINGALHVLRNPDCTIDELIELIPAPDFPTAGIIYGVSGVRDGYRTGRGRVVMRAKTHFEEYGKDGGRIAIIVDELPYQVNKKSLLERIAENVRDKKLEGISDIRDESDKSGMRVVIELKRGEVPEVVLNNLYKQTQLQDTFGMNMVALVNGQPKLLNLKQMLECFLSHRREVVTRRTVFELRKARERGHMLEGLAVALANIDDFIAIIKAAPTPPVAKTELMQRAWDSSLVREMLLRTEGARIGGIEAFRPEHLPKHYGMQPDGLYKLSDEQAQEILQMRLQRLTGLEQDKIVNEYKEVMAHIADLLDILAKPERVTTIISRRDGADQERLHRERQGRAPLGHRAQCQRPRYRRPDHAAGHGGDPVAHRLHEVAADLRIPRAEARRPRQAGDGDQGRGLDRPAVHRQHARLHAVLLDRGRMYWLKVWEVPQGSRNSRGKPIVNMFPLQDGEKITVILPLSGENRPSRKTITCSCRPAWAPSRRPR